MTGPLVESLAESVLDALGMTGTFSDRHRAWVKPLFVMVSVAVVAALVVAITMVAFGHS